MPMHCLSLAEHRGLRGLCSVRRALENTCKPVGNGPDAALTYGRGLLQVRMHFYLPVT